MGNKTVSVCIPVYKAEKRIKRVIESFLAQSHEDFEIVICDNASTDGTVDMVREFEDPRIRLFQNDINIGAMRNMNRVLARADGDFVFIANGTDVYESSMLEDCLEVMNSSESVGIVHADYRFIDENETVIREPDSSLLFTSDHRNPVDAASLVMSKFVDGALYHSLYRRRILERCWPIPQRYAADHILLAQASLYGDIKYVPKILKYRVENPRSANDHVRLTMDEYVWGVEETSAFNRFRYLMPFVEMIMGHVEMFSLQSLSDTEKGQLVGNTRKIFIERFGRFLEQDIQRLASFVNSNREIIQKNPRSLLVCRLRNLVNRAHFVLPQGTLDESILKTFHYTSSDEALVHNLH